MDTIFIEDLRVDTVIGIYDWEQHTRQVVSLDIEMRTNIQSAAASDAIEHTVNYKKIAKRLISYIQNSHFQLIETLIERVAQIIQYEFGVEWVCVRLSKPGAVRYSKNVGVEITREAIIESPQLVYISVGSNIQPEQNIALALSALGREFGSLRQSTIYQNPAVGFDGEDFLNLVVEVNTALPPAVIVNRLNHIETQYGRERGDEKFSARSLDLDLLLYGQMIRQNDTVKLPRDDITRYAFVLKPLAELAPDFIHPQLELSLSELWKGFTGESSLTPVDIKVTEATLNTSRLAN